MTDGTALRRITLAVTGAGGTGAARRLVMASQDDDRVEQVHLIVSHAGRKLVVTEAGAIVYPMIPTYCNVPETLTELQEELVERLLEMLGLARTDRYAWDGTGTPARREHARVR